MRTSQWTRAGAAIAALTLTACFDRGGNDAKGGDGGTAGQGGTGATGQGGTGGAGQGGGDARAECDTGELDVQGVWAGRAAMTVGFEQEPGGLLAVCPEEQEGTADLLFLMTIGQSGTGLQDVRAVICDAALPPMTAVMGACSPGSTDLVTLRTLVPEALTRTLPTLEVQPITGTLSRMTPGARLQMAPLRITAGAAPAVEELPRWNLDDPTCDGAGVGRSSVCEAQCVNDCGSLRDDDGDTFPGVTVDACGFTAADAGKPCPVTEPGAAGPTLQGRAFMAIRIEPQISGVAESSCVIRGNVTASITYSIVGADLSLVGLPLPVSAAIEAFPALVAKPEESFVSLVRVDGKHGARELPLDMADPAAACQRVREQANQIF